VNLGHQNVAQELGLFVRERFQISETDTNFTYDVHLWDQAYVDSLGIAEIIAFLEDRFQVEVPEDALFEEDRSTINGLARLVQELVVARQTFCEERTTTMD
jgi:acyl carrier protein